MIDGTTVGNLVELQRGQTYKSSLLGEQGPVLLGLASIQRDGGFRNDSLPRYGGDTPEKLLLFPGDLYVSLKDVTQSGDLLGSVARVPASVDVGRLTQDTVKLVLREGVPTGMARYLYWILRSPEYRSYCRARGTGTTNLSLGRADFLSFRVPSPDADRATLVATLDGLDDKIELNRQMSGTLEETARAIFTSWFVDFDPVHGTATVPNEIRHLFPNRLVESPIGPIPQGWSIGRFGDYVENVRHQVDPRGVPSSTPYIGLEHMPRGAVSLSDWASAEGLVSGKLTFSAGDVLFGKLRPYFHKVGIAPMDGICSSDILVLRSIESGWSTLPLMIASSRSFVAHADATGTGTRMPRTSWKDLSDFPVARPPDGVINAFEGFVRPLVRLIVSAIHESKTLAKLRDTLLPALISGKLRLTHPEPSVPVDSISRVTAPD